MAYLIDLAWSDSRNPVTVGWYKHQYEHQSQLITDVFETCILDQGLEVDNMSPVLCQTMFKFNQSAKIVIAFSKYWIHKLLNSSNGLYPIYVEKETKG